LLQAEFNELAKVKEKSVINVWNLQKAYSLVLDWEKFIETDDGKLVIR